MAESLTTPDAEHPSARILHQELGDILATIQLECREQILLMPKPRDDQLYCNTTFDGWSCWNYTLAGTVATNLCPVFLSNDGVTVSRKCDVNGSWEAWTNYTLCSVYGSDSGAHNFAHIYIFVAGYCVSILMLLASLGIFFAFWQLRCERITIHKNLFVSYVLTGVSWILYYVLVTLDGEVLIFNPIWCRALHVMAHYCVVSNFAWMFCEGLYLHVIMVQAFRTGKALLRALFFVGWGIPAILTFVYACARALASHKTNKCWIYDDVFQWIIFGPVVAFVVVNIFILINLVRLLLTKLHQVPEASQSKKAVRATLILVPLFGLQYLVFPVRPDEGTPFYDFYHYFVAILCSGQGALVSIMYCFCNGEVTSLIKRKWHQHRLMSGHVRKNTALNNSSTYTEGYSMVNTSMRDLSSQKSKVALDMHAKHLQDTVEMKPLKMEANET